MREDPAIGGAFFVLVFWLNCLFKRLYMEPFEKHLWILARKRAHFRTSLSLYLITSAFMWAIWWFMYGDEGLNMRWPWPIWPMLAWGIILLFQYYDAWHGDKSPRTEREFEKLKRKQNTGN